MIRLRPFLLPLGLSVLMLLIALSDEYLQQALRYDRQAIAEGQLWRLLSGHFVHMSSGHLIMNMLGLGLIAMFFWPLLGNWHWLGAIALSAMAVSGAIYAFDSQVLWYVGFSGVLHGLFVVASLANIRVRPGEGRLLLTLIGIKLLWEQVLGPLPGSEQTAGGPVLVDAHLYGAVAGALYWLALRPGKR